MKSNVVVVCGSRTWNDAAIISRRLKKLPRGTIIRHGGARGADNLAGRVARSLGFKVEEFKADWGRYGKAAGFRRNIDMLDTYPKPYLVIAFWDGTSTGTKHTLDQADRREINTDIVLPDRVNVTVERKSKGILNVTVGE